MSYGSIAYKPKVTTEEFYASEDQTIFILSKASSCEISVEVNGLKNYSGFDNDYTTSGNQLIFNYGLVLASKVFITYN